MFILVVACHFRKMRARVRGVRFDHARHKPMTKHMPHYIRRYRLRAGLTQGEMTHLLGNESPATVCQYEGLTREPDLRSALAYHVVFGVPLHELFPGIYDHVENEVTNNASGGLRLNDTELSTIARNEISANGGIGILLENGATINRVIRNQVNGNSVDLEDRNTNCDNNKPDYA